MKLGKLDLSNRKIKDTKKLYLIGNKSINDLKINTDRKSIESYCHLPPIDKSIKKLAMQKPTSILNRYISKHAKDIINYTEQNIKTPVKILKSRNENYKKRDYFIKSYKNTELNLEKMKVKSRPKKKLNKISLAVLLNNKTKNQKIEKFNTNNNELLTNNDDLNLSEDNEINLNDLYDKYNNETKERHRSLVNTIKRDSKKSKEIEKNRLNSFRRIRCYQPDIKINWKYNYGLQFTPEKSKDVKNSGDDINHQSKVIDNHYSLLLNEINIYKTTFIVDSNYLPSFEGISLMQKINYNKALEETIGILALLPKLLLNDFFDLINNSYSIKIPKLSQFEDKYVYDEVKNLKENNKLFFEIINYFQECYQIFQTIVKQIDKILFKPNQFNKIISCFEKARFNISYINNSSENAIDSYKKDLELIDRLKGKRNKSIKNLSEKLRENYSFRHNEEKQKKIRINNSLTNRNNDNFDTIKKFLESSPYKNHEIKSIVNSKMMNSIIRHCNENSRLIISTQRINDEIEGPHGEDLPKKKFIPPVIKMNLL